MVASSMVSYSPGAAAEAPARDPSMAAIEEYETILDPARLEAWIADLRRAGRFALDTETDSLDPMRARLVGISFAAEPGRAAYLPLGHDYPGAPPQLGRDVALALLRPLLEDPQVAKIGQHGKDDLHVFRRHGMTAVSKKNLRAKEKEGKKGGGGGLEKKKKQIITI